MRQFFSFFVTVCLMLSCSGGMLQEKEKDVYTFGPDGCFMSKETKVSMFDIVLMAGDGSAQNLFFADPESDAKAVDSGAITRIVVIGEDTISGILRDHGAFKDSWWDFIAGSAPFASADERISRRGEFMHDYSATELCDRFGGHTEGTEIKSDCLFVAEGDAFAQNIMNFGNFLWGATGYTVGLPRYVLLMGSHAYRFHETTLRSLFKKGSRFHPEFDSADDQLSIAAGANFAQRNGYRNLHD